jgi:hypothetical protein
MAVLGLVVVPVFGFTPAADAVGYGVCTITGTITFSSESPEAGSWNIGAAAIDCQGLIAGRRRIIGRGPFNGSGSFSSVPPVNGGCLQQNGIGKVNYKLPTTSGVITVSEPVNHTLAGTGVLNTPTLHGLFQLSPSYNGDCMTKPVGKTSFVAEVLLYRYPREVPWHLIPDPTRFLATGG